LSDRYEPKEIIMNPIRHIRRLAATLAGLAGALLAFAAAAPAALASPPPTPGPGWNKHPPLPTGHVFHPVHQGPVPVLVHTVNIGGMHGWQITLIAAGAALVAATVAVLADRVWAARRTPVTAGA
jgi:hypothetical protein